MLVLHISRFANFIYDLSFWAAEAESGECDREKVETEEINDGKEQTKTNKKRIGS